ncbi:MAG: GNAT family N-acetyltransferase [Candidatus Acetothermia bacterium]|jgi:GNAT superfamily N-acetyltransferase|nr:GNAT family N-acetyltransferase [Candidatus Acetothermia bacterium]MDH7504677.1 GNAT family N-acetyltransferase [Candidatus Acetothermia bacterium]
MIKLRQFEPQDYEALCEIDRAIYPEYRYSAEEWRYDDEHFDRTKYTLRRYVAQLGDEVVGYGQYRHSPHMFHPRRFWLTVAVQPRHQGRGVGRALYNRLNEELEALPAEIVWAQVREDRPAGLAFAERRGFREKMREWESWLDVSAFDFAKFAGEAERAEAQGIEITTLAEERERDPQCLEKLYELSNLIMVDVPSPAPYTPPPFEHFLEYNIRHPNAIPDAYFIAKDSPVYVGQSDLWRSKEEPKDLYQGLTGVRREYRGRGIAMALKLRTIEYAKSHGFRVIKTWNNSNNVGILHINQKLGFARRPAWITLEKARQ